MKKKSKRYYGMTVSQIGILAAAAILVLLIVAVGFTLILMQTRSQAQLPVATAISLPTLTPAPDAALSTDTPAPSAESPLTTPTLAPVSATGVPPGGWLQFTTQGATLWLPANFVGGDMVSNKQSTINKVSRLGRVYSNIVIQMKKADPQVAMWMVDKTPRLTDVITTINVQHIITTEEISVDQYLQDYLNGDYQGTPVAMFIAINENKKTTVLGREARRLVYSETYAGHGLTGVAYYIKDKANIWIVAYGFVPRDFPEMEPIIEQSIQTFNLIP